MSSIPSEQTIDLPIYQLQLYYNTITTQLFNECRPHHGFTDARSTHDQKLVVVDLFTGNTHLIPTSKYDTAEDTLVKFKERLCTNSGLPLTVLTDGGSKFAGAFHNGLTDMGITHWKTSSYRAKANGANERMNTLIKQSIRAHLPFIESNWPEHLASTEFFINDREHSATQRSSNELRFGFQPRWVERHQQVEYLRRNPKPKLMSEEEWMNFLDKLTELIQTLIQGNKDKNKSTVEKRGKAQTFQVDDQVLNFKHVLRPVGKASIQRTVHWACNCSTRSPQFFLHGIHIEYEDPTTGQRRIPKKIHQGG